MQQQKVFILEDDNKRIEIFLQEFGEFAEFIIAKDYYEAIKLFDVNEDYALIMLDHDLGGKIYVEISEENTGSGFCRWLKKNRNKISPVILHSHNPVGVEIMQELLIDSGFDPTVCCFDSLMSLWEKGRLSFLGHYKFDKE
jgi:CheY-like chemotaxis protein